MILVFFFASVVLLFCPSLLHAMPICPESFNCPDFGPFKYPFYNTTDTRCGLIRVNCTSNHQNIQFGGRSYDILEKTTWPRYSFVIRNRTFEKLLESKSCNALMNNFTSPTPLLFLFRIGPPQMTLFKCTKDPNYAAYIDAYFNQPNYNSYNGCKDHKFYYNKHPTINITVSIPSDLSHWCDTIQLPLKLRLPDDHDLANETNIFSYLTPNFFISFWFPSCDKCHNQDRHHCYNDNGNFQCLDDKKDNRKLILILVLCGSGFILMLSSVIFILRHRYKRNPFSYISSKDKTPDLEDRNGVSVFSYTELKDATQNFDPSKVLGDGGFGAVYYGKLQDGREVAVKRLYENNYKRVQHFMNEVEILTRLRHPNLVVLYGCTSRQSRELLLVYEYIPNGTVADHLHGKQANPSLLTWPIRMNIAIATASALVYLHASEIVHRDVKTNNILLDHNFCVKVADFGLSRPLPNDVTHVSTAPQGTPGYLDPQYHQRYHLTEKSDVYSFGVVLIELISSMVAVDLSRSQDEISLANLAINRIQRRAFERLIDPVLVSDTNAEILRMITSVAELAFRCLQFDSEMRPTMKEVLDVLEEIKAEGRRDAIESIGELKTVTAPPPSSENKDAVVLLKDFLRSPLSVTSEWQSASSGSTTISIS